MNLKPICTCNNSCSGLYETEYIAIQSGEKVFKLYDIVHLILKNGMKIRGEIDWIGENSLDILPKKSYSHPIIYSEIISIS